MIKADMTLRLTAAAVTLAGIGLLCRRPNRGSRSTIEPEMLLEDGILPADAAILYWQPILAHFNCSPVRRSIGGRLVVKRLSEELHSGYFDADGFAKVPYIEGNQTVMITPDGKMFRVDGEGRIHGEAHPTVEIVAEPATHGRPPGASFSALNIMDYCLRKFSQDSGPELTDPAWEARTQPNGQSILVDNHGQAFAVNGNALIPATVSFIVRLS